MSEVNCAQPQAFGDIAYFHVDLIFVVSDIIPLYFYKCGYLPSKENIANLLKSRTTNKESKTNCTRMQPKFAQMCKVKRLLLTLQTGDDCNQKLLGKILTHDNIFSIFFSQI